MGEAPLDPEHALPCGRTIGELLDHLAGEAPEDFGAHVRTCPHCRAALAELAPTGWEPVRRAAELAVEPPEGLVSRALLTVRGARAAAGGEPAEVAQEFGTLRISAQATLVLARRLSAELLADVPEARLLSCTGDVREVRVDVVIGYGVPAPALTARLQDDLGRALREHLGAAAPSVWVRVADVAPPQGS
ncbi:hypothetical protein [Saccharopolyspora gregorii]|uniref:Asp23/Gls24 family envelope stress response protein n=1 Tax=Saccharopolyspora gregorii TaxID=33914 RepID=A0ABP6RVW3_9PSEU|nr:hypothetical protein [Saccharopolyspora gregorii]